MNDLFRLDAAALAAGYAEGRFTPVDVLEACQSRARACQPLLNPFVAFDRAGAAAQARDSAARWARREPLGPLDGVPVSVKDNLHVRGLPTTWGSRLLGDFVPADDERPVARLRAAGALLFAKTNLPELAMQGVTANPRFGATRNPWRPDLTPGGSSGGAAAAVAAGCGPLALCTDGGGSARRPAAHCGVVGFKPSAGAVPRGGGLPAIFAGYEVVGTLARSVGDVRTMMQALGDPLPPSDEGARRIRLVTAFGDRPVDARIVHLPQRAADRFASLGHQVEEAPQVFSLADRLNTLWPIVGAAGLARMFERLPAFPEFAGRCADGSADTLAALLDEPARAALAQGRALRGARLFELMTAIETAEGELRALFAATDCLLTPCIAAPAWPIGDTHPAIIDGRDAGSRDHAVFTALANAAGLPAISLPAGFVDGLPVGVQLIGPRGSDAALLALSGHYQRIADWRGQWPPEA